MLVWTGVTCRFPTTMDSMNYLNILEFNQTLHFLCDFLSRPIFHLKIIFMYIAKQVHISICINKTSCCNKTISMLNLLTTLFGTRFRNGHDQYSMQTIVKTSEGLVQQQKLLHRNYCLDKWPTHSTIQLHLLASYLKCKCLHKTQDDGLNFYSAMCWISDLHIYELFKASSICS